MTSNQINMLRYLEDVRHNQEAEAEIRRSNRAREHETYRSDLAQETNTRLQLLELNRHNTMSEYLTSSNLAESIRHSKAIERETNRANEAKEVEVNRHNKREEEIKEATIESQIQLNQSKTIGSYVGAAVDLVGSALGWWKATSGNKSKSKSTSKKKK